jgi:hypothetical protein
MGPDRGQVVAERWVKKRLLADPSAVLKEEGLNIPAGVQVRVMENTDRLVHLTIPPKRWEGELSDDDLENVAGGPSKVRQKKSQKPCSRTLKKKLLDVIDLGRQQILRSKNSCPRCTF